MNPPNAPPRSSIRVALNLPFRTAEVAEYLFRSDVLQHWLSKDSKLCPELASTALLPHAIAVDREIEYSTPLCGVVTSLAWPAAATVAKTDTGQAPDGEFFELVVTLDCPPATRRFTFRLAPRMGHLCRVRIEQSGITSVGEAHASVKVWQSALNRVGRLMAQANKKSPP